VHVAFVSNVVYPFVKGGAEKRLHEIGTRLVERGHDVTVYGRHYWDGPAETTHEGMTLRAVAPAAELYTGERRSIPEAIDFAARMPGPLRRHRSEHDLIDVSVFPYFPVLAGRLATLGSEVPLVTTWHEVWRSYWEEYLDRLAPLGKAVERAAATVAQRPVAVSGVTADRLASIGPARESIAVVPNGVDVDRIESVAPASDGYDVLFAGRLAEHKNVDLLLEAFDEVARGRELTLGVIGDGPEAERLRTQARRLDGSEAVTFLGFLEEYRDVLAHMRAADVFVSPSTREGFGITFVEAMAADCVTVGVDHPESAAGEVIDGGGFLAEPTTESLASTLERALEEERPSESPRSVARRYDWEAITTRAERVYRDVVDG